MIGSGNLLLAMLAQKFRKSRLRYREMRGAQALPNFFLVAECPRIIATGLMAYQVLLVGLFPRFNGGRFLGGFHGLVLLCTQTVENNRENSKKNFPMVAHFHRKRACSSAVRAGDS